MLLTQIGLAPMALRHRRSQSGWLRSTTFAPRWGTTRGDRRQRIHNGRDQPQPVQLVGDRLTLVAGPAASSEVERLLVRLRRGTLIEPLDLPETVWLVLGIVVLEQPITRAEITARRLADSDRQVQLLLQRFYDFVVG
jgi:hypothetical protein